MRWALVLAVPLVVLWAFRVYNKRTAGRCRCSARMDGKVVIVTGADSGIGKEVARDLAARGARVLMACLDLRRAAGARDEIVASTGNREVVVRHVDLLSLRSVRGFARAVLRAETRLDVLVNNAGAINTPFEYTEDNLVQGMQVNHFGPFLLTCLLLELLKKTPSSRIVSVASAAHPFGFFDVENMNGERGVCRSFSVYCNSKLCVILAVQHLADKLRGTGITVNCLHPGTVHTNVAKDVASQIAMNVTSFLGGSTEKSSEMDWTLHPGKMYLNMLRDALGQFIEALGCFVVFFFFKTAEMGAQTVIHLAVSEEAGRVSGEYFVDVKPVIVGGAARTPGLAAEVWRRSEAYVKLTDAERHF